MPKSAAHDTQASARRLTVFAPEHRRRSIANEPRGGALSARAYDHQVGAYFEFLREQAARVGIEMQVDAQDRDVLFEVDHEGKKAVRAWLARQPDLWDWLPSADASSRPIPP